MTGVELCGAFPDGQTERQRDSEWLELRRLPPIMGFVGSGLRGLVILLA